MPLYSFKDLDTGEPIELFYQMGQAPGLGEKIRHKGRHLQRLVEAPMGRVKPEKRFKAYSQPHKDRHGNLPPGAIEAPHYDSDGVPVFTSKKEVDAYVAKSEGRVVTD